MQQSVPASKDLTFALAVVRSAGLVAMQHFRQGIKAQMKADNTPVTEADQQCERLIREALAREFPSDNILGEEEDESVHFSDVTRSTRTWIIDPIDGTYNFARQIPIWAMLLALESDGEIILGVVHAPAMDETFWAEKGGGAFRNGEAIRVSTIEDVSQSQFVFGSPSRIIERGYWEGLERVIVNTYRQRAFGDYLNFAHVFTGKAEAVLEVGVKPWDLAAMKIIGEEAGGIYSDLTGGKSIYAGDCLISNRPLHQEMLTMLTK